VCLRDWPWCRYLTAHDRAPLGWTIRYKPGIWPSGISRRSAPGRMPSTVLTVRRMSRSLPDLRGNLGVTLIPCLRLSGNVYDMTRQMPIEYDEIWGCGRLRAARGPFQHRFPHLLLGVDEGQEFGRRHRMRIVAGRFEFGLGRGIG